MNEEKRMNFPSSFILFVINLMLLHIGIHKTYISMYIYSIYIYKKKVYFNLASLINSYQRQIRMKTRGMKNKRKQNNEIMKRNSPVFMLLVIEN